MPRARIRMNKVREIIRLHETVGMSIRMIARALSISRPAVDHYLVQARRARLKWAKVQPMSDEELLERLQADAESHMDPRQRELSGRLPEILRELGKKHVTRQLLWEEYREHCPDGYEYSRFCHHLQMYASGSELSMHLDHEPGGKVFVDFAGDRPLLGGPQTGTEKPVELFVAVFPASGLVYGEATYSQKIEDFVRATRHTFEYAGGTPKIIVPDNLKAAVTKADRYEPQINATYEDFARYYGCAVIPARPRKPRDKALVEAAVNLLYTRVLAPLRHRSFTTLEELNGEIREGVDRLNERQMKKLGISRRQRFTEIEAEHLSPLPVGGYVIRRFIDAMTVQINYHLYFPVDKHYYSVPFRYRGKKVRLAYTDREIEIYHNNTRIAAHRRERTAHRYTTNRDHMPSQHRFMSEWNPQRFLRWAAKIGTATEILIGALLSDGEVPEQAYRRCIGILNLAKKYGDLRLEAASGRANHFGVCTYKGVKSILDRGLDRQEEPKLIAAIPTAHPNIRGHQYYSRLSGSTTS